MENTDGSHICRPDGSQREETIVPATDVHSSLVEVEKPLYQPGNTWVYTQQFSWDRKKQENEILLNAAVGSPSVQVIGG